MNPLLHVFIVQSKFTVTSKVNLEIRKILRSRSRSSGLILFEVNTQNLNLNCFSHSGLVNATRLFLIYIKSHGYFKVCSKWIDVVYENSNHVSKILITKLFYHYINHFLVMNLKPILISYEEFPFQLIFYYLKPPK